MGSSILVGLLVWLAGASWFLSLYLLRRPWPHVRFHERLPLRLGGVEVLALLALWLVMQTFGQGAFLALRGAPSYELTASDVLDWPAFTKKLVESDRSSVPEASLDSEATPNVPEQSSTVANEKTFDAVAGRIWRRMSPEAQRAARVLASGAADSQQRQRILDDLNRMLKSRDFYEPADFPGPEFELWRELPLDELNDQQIQRLNRQLLEASLPNNIQSSWRALFVAVAVIGTLTAAALLFAAVYMLRVPWRRLGLGLTGFEQWTLYGLCQASFWGPLALVCSGIMRQLMPPEAIHPAQSFFVTPHPLADWLLLIYAVVVLAPVSEELVFRGILQSWLSRRVPPWAAIGASALLFGMAHSSTWPDPIALTLLGVGLGVTYQKSRSLWSCISFHAVFNAFGVAAGWANS